MGSSVCHLVYCLHYIDIYISSKLIYAYSHSFLFNNYFSRLKSETFNNGTVSTVCTAHMFHAESKARSNHSQFLYLVQNTLSSDTVNSLDKHFGQCPNINFSLIIIPPSCSTIALVVKVQVYCDYYR